MNDATTAAEGVTKPVTLPLLIGVATEAGYVQPRISWPRETTTPALEPAWAGEFRSFDDWVNFASKRLTDAGRTDVGYAAAIPSVCIDAKGRRCNVGAHFQRARDEDAFPVRFFWDFRPAQPEVPTWPRHRMRIDLAGVCHTTNDMLNRVEHPLRGVPDDEDMAAHSAFFDQLLGDIAAVKAGKASLADFADFYCITEPTGIGD
jgi:hypothetical protein